MMDRDQGIKCGCMHTKTPLVLTAQMTKCNVRNVGLVYAKRTLFMPFVYRIYKTDRIYRTFLFLKCFYYHQLFATNKLLW